MQQYIGVKIVGGTPMTRGEYNKYRGWSLPPEENGDDPGYLVEYPPESGQNQNHPDHNGYISWCPKDVFERHNRPTNGMTFGMAIEAAKLGYKVTRGFERDVPGLSLDDFGLAYNPTRTDMLSEDWFIVE